MNMTQPDQLTLFVKNSDQFKLYQLEVMFACIVCIPRHPCIVSRFFHVKKRMCIYVYNKNDIQFGKKIT